MRKIIFVAVSAALLSLALIIPYSCISLPEDLDTDKIHDELSSVQAKAIEEIKDALDQPLVIVSQEGDTVVAYAPDSVAEGTATRKITVRIDEKSDIRPVLLDKQRQVLMAVTAIIIPCVTVLLIALAILIFIYLRNRSRNRIIEQAIEKGIELPESFYTGQSNTTRVIYDNTASAAHQPQGQPQPQSVNNPVNPVLPPLPPTPPVDTSNLQSGIKLAVVGLCVLIFFFVCDFHAAPVAILAGGIPMLLGLGRIATWYYFNKRN